MAIQSVASDSGRLLTIQIQGRFDFSCLQAFRHSYEAVDVKPERYIVDMKECDYLDSSALGMLLALRDYAGGDDANISLQNCTNDVRKILLITKLDELFDVAS
ncbi:MAG: STAS domain-containing protein [Gammaproteobacteria bacterium]|nr:STAS domain-containing protein [Gammaproteobacteria bacterium]